ncbi:Ubiquitin fusion degradation protein 4 [Coemansia sp. RSA 2050]|nr:Ubiquitin fusion degradation protein 4 [Coemansia sp. RSA 2050]
MDSASAPQQPEGSARGQTSSSQSSREPLTDAAPSTAGDDGSFGPMEICEVDSVDAGDVEASHIEVDEDDSDSDNDSSGDNGDESEDESESDTDSASEGSDDEPSDDDEEGDADEADVRDDLSSLENILGGRHAELLASAGLSIGGLARFNSTNQFRPLLAALKQYDNQTQQLIALQELTELLSISTEDSLVGLNFGELGQSLVNLLKGADGDYGELTGFVENNVDIMLLACRCLSNLLEALPLAGGLLVRLGVIEVLCSKLLEIEYIDLAEQALSTLMQMSKEFPAKVCEAGGLSACLLFLDFFATGTQRTALSCAANCAQGVTKDQFPQAKDAVQVLERTLFYADQKCTEYSCHTLLCLIRAFRSLPELVGQLVSPSLLVSIIESISPDRAASISAPPTLLLRILTAVAHSSPERAAQALDADIIVVLERIVKLQFIGAADCSALSTRTPTRLDSVARVSDHAWEALRLLVALLPPLPSTLDAVAQSGALASGGSNSDITPGSASNDAKPSPQLLWLPESLLRPQTIQQLQQTLVSTLIAAYHSTMSAAARHCLLLAVLRVLFALNAEQLLVALKGAKLPTFIASAISSVESPLHSAVTLLIARIALDRLPGVFARDFIREGVADGLAQLASSSRAALARAESLHDAPTESESSQSEGNDAMTAPTEADGKPTDVTSLIHAAMVVNAHAPRLMHSALAGRSSSQSSARDGRGNLLGSDTNALHEIVVCQAQLLHGQLVAADASEPNDASVFAQLRRLSQQLSAKSVSAEDVRAYAASLSKMLVSADGVTCYELTQSGLIESLVDALDRETDATRRGVDPADMLAACLLAQRSAVGTGEAATTTVSAYEILVQRLHEALGIAENLTINETYRLDSGVACTPADMLTRQLRLCVSPASEECMSALTEASSPSEAAKEAVATMARVRQSFRAITVSVHAVASFSALEAYLRPRVALFVGKRVRQSPQRSARLASALFDGEPVPDEGSTELRPQQAQLDQQPISAMASGSRHDLHRGSAAQVGKQHLRMLQMIARSSGIDLQAAGLLDDQELSDSDDDSSGGSSSEGHLVGASANQHTEKQGNDESESVLADDGGGSKASSNSSSTLGDWRLVLALKTGGTERTVESSDNIFQAIHNACQSNDELRDANPWTQTFQLQFRVEFGKPRLLPPLRTPLSSPSLQGDIADADQELRSVFGERCATIIRAIKLLHSRLLLVQRLAHSPLAVSSFGNATDLAFPLSSYKCGAGELSAEAFVNYKLTAKVARQLDDPLMVVCSALPNWCHLLIRHAPFMVSFDARVAYLRATSFGHSRNVSRWQAIAQREAHGSGSGSSRAASDTLVSLGRMQRQKVRISRSRMLDSALKVLELYGTAKSVLEVEYFDEVGTGLGPTLEFYSTVSQCLQERQLGLWREARAAAPAIGTLTEYVDAPHGLFPQPVKPADMDKPDLTHVGASSLQLFNFAGHFVAKGLIDGRVLDLPLHEEFWAAIQRYVSAARHGDCEFAWSWCQLEAVDQDTANSLRYLYRFVKAKDEVYARKDVSMEQMQLAAEAIQDPKSQATISDLALDFTLPGSPEIELRAGGADIPVTISNVHTYVDLVARWILDLGIRSQVEAFCAGFDKVFPCRDLLVFTPAELCRIVGPSSESEDWSGATLRSAIKAEHGYSLASPAVQMFLGFMESLDGPDRRSFLRFVTGAPRLPLGGFRALHPPLTLVQKMSEAPLSPDDCLPSVMTCANFIKLPNYSSLEVLKRRWGHAVAEGQQSFHLS